MTEQGPYRSGRADRTTSWAARQLPNKALSAMLIAHNPGIQDLALTLATSGPALAGLPERFPTGALTTVELDVERWRDLDNGTSPPW